MSRFQYSDNLYPAYKAGIAYGLLGDKNGKVNVLSRALKANPSVGYYSEAMYELGRGYVAAGNNDAAIKTFDKLRVNTDDKTIAARSLIELGMIYRNMSEFDKSLGYYKRVVEDMPGTEYANDALAAIESIYQTDGRTDEYLDYADKVGAIKDKSAGEKESMYFAAAEQLYLSENWNKALASLQNYLERYPTGKDALKAGFYTAECYRALGKKEQACDWYKKTVDNSDGGSYTEAAMLNFSRLSCAAKIEVNKHTARVGMTRSAYKSGDYSSAISCADKVKADPKSSEAELREADYIKAKSLLSTNERSRAFEIFGTLASKPSTNEGAEAAFMMIQEMREQSFILNEVRQGEITLTAPLDNLKERFLDGNIINNNNPMFNWYLGNVKLTKRSANGTYLPTKQSVYRKIDGFAAFLDAHTEYLRKHPLYIPEDKKLTTVLSLQR